MITDFEVPLKIKCHLHKGSPIRSNEVSPESTPGEHLVALRLGIEHELV